MGSGKIKLEYVTRIVDDDSLHSRVKLRVIRTLLAHDSEDQSLRAALTAMKDKLEDDLTEDDVPSIQARYDESERNEGSPEGADDMLIRAPENPSPDIPAISRADANKDSGDLIEEIKLTTETMKSSFLRMKDHMAKDESIFDRAKEAQISNQDGTRAANAQSSAFVSATRVGLIEMFTQVLIAFLLGIIALYFV